MEREIEKKYKVKKLPENLEEFEHMLIEQSYLTKAGAAIRLRKFIHKDETKCVFSKKCRIGENECIEYNIELPDNIYKELLKTKEGRTIVKTRYKIPIQDGLKVDLDIFHDFFEGVCTAEIEFNSKEQADNYKIPDWLGEEMPNSGILSNRYMATEAEDIGKYRQYYLQ